MALEAEIKAQIIKEYGTFEGDTVSACAGKPVCGEVQPWLDLATRCSVTVTWAFGTKSAVFRHVCHIA